MSLTTGLDKVDLTELNDLFDSFVGGVTDASDATATNQVQLHWQVILDDIPTLDRTVLLPPRVAQIVQEQLSKLVLVSGELSTETVIGFNTVEHQAITAKNLINVWDSILDFYASGRTTGVKIIEAADAKVEDYLGYLASLELFTCRVLADPDSDDFSDSEDSATYSDCDSAEAKIASSATQSVLSEVLIDKSQKELSFLPVEENSQHSATVPSLLAAVGDSDDTQWLIPQGQFILVSFDHRNELGESINKTNTTNTAALINTSPIDLTLRLFSAEN